LKLCSCTQSLSH